MICFILGTRPEIIKLSPIINECDRRGLKYMLIHTGQHYNKNLNKVFFDQLNLPDPDYALNIGSGPSGEQTGKMILRIEPILLDEDPDIVLIQGDTNSVLAGAIAASKLPVAVGHVEAGLRSYQDDMAEEINRRVADQISDELFAPTSQAIDTLESENFSKDRIHKTGNTIVDAVYRNIELAIQNSTILDEISTNKNEYVLLTAHRAENADVEANIRGIIEGVAAFATKLNLDVIYPIHPRTANSIDHFDIKIPNQIELVEPMDYLDFLLIQNRAEIIFTDSGGIQEEACILGVPCITLREQTERPETIEVGSNVLAGTDPKRILKEGLKMVDKQPTWSNPFGDGQSASKIIDILDGKYI
jgi:UDP-N-acetylglucosamine 2-epimerase (non-hydrolysing)